MKTAVYVSGGRGSYIQNELGVSLSSYGNVDAQTAPNFLNPNNIGLWYVPWVETPSSATYRSFSAIYVSGGRCTYTQNEFEGSLSPHGDVDAQTALNFMNPNNIDAIVPSVGQTPLLCYI